MALQLVPVLFFLHSSLHIACLCQLWLMHFIHRYHLSSFPLSFFISSVLQLIVPNLHLNIGTANAPIAVILFVALSSDFIIILLLYFCCIPVSIFLSFVNVLCLHFPQPLGIFRLFPVLAVVFLC